MAIILPSLVLGTLGGMLVLLGGGHLWLYVRLKQSRPDDALQWPAAGTVVELEGTARPHQTTSPSPFTRTDCLLHKWSLQEYNPVTFNEGLPWTQLAAGDAAVPFLLDTTAGTVLVDPEGANFALRPSTTIEVDGNESPAPSIAQFLDRMDTIDRIGSVQRRYHEQRLDPGGAVHVLGPLRDPDPSFDTPTGIDAVMGLPATSPSRLSTGGNTFAMVLNQLLPGAAPFLIANTDKQGTQHTMLRWGLLLLLFGLPFVALTTALLLL